MFCKHSFISKLGDVVVEDPLPDAGTLMMLCGEMVPAQRPLKPTRVERKKVLMQDITGRVFKNP